MNDIVFEVLKCAVIVCIMVLCRHVIPWVKAQMDATQYSFLMELARTAVLFAEQTISGSGNGKLKKAVVRDYLEDLLARKKIHITEERLDALIEAAVNQMKREDILAQPIIVQEPDAAEPRKKGGST